jgi:hypothetical protein
MQQQLTSPTPERYIEHQREGRFQSAGKGRAYRAIRQCNFDLLSARRADAGLYSELLEDVPGALWTHGLVEATRVAAVR